MYNKIINLSFNKKEVVMKNKLRNLAIVVSIVISAFTFSQDILAQTQRNPVLEECTGTWCQWCPCGHTIMAQIKAAMPNAIMIGYHGPANSSSDPLLTATNSPPLVCGSQRMFFLWSSNPFILWP